MDIIILKIGGGLITRGPPARIIHSNVSRIAREVSNASNKKIKLIIIHGAGSFGYPVLDRYNLHKKIITQEQRIGVAKLIASVSQLNSLIAKVFTEAGVNVFPISIASSTLGFSGKIYETCTEIISNALKLKYIPLLHGSLVADKIFGYDILTGDEIIEYLCEKYKEDIKKIIFVTNVDGLFTDDPKRDKAAKLIRYLEINTFIENFGFDPLSEEPPTKITKIVKKSSTFLRIANKYGIPSLIINGRRDKLLEMALLDRDPHGTIITPT